MTSFKYWLLALGLMLPVAAQVPSTTQQLLVVTTPDWPSSQGQLQRYLRQKANWQPLGRPVPVVVGKNGLGWGRGLFAIPQKGPIKREGDGRAPAGIFSLGTAYGYPPQPPTGTTLPYQQSQPLDRCVDDSQSVAYNQILPQTRASETPWTSAEEMIRPDELYRLLVVIQHNTQPPQPQGGSCIFMHIWRSPTSPTVGCTALAEEQLSEVVRWLKPSAQPLLVQLPESVYSSYQKLWNLPKRSGK